MVIVKCTFTVMFFPTNDQVSKINNYEHLCVTFVVVLIKIAKFKKNSLVCVLRTNSHAEYCAYLCRGGVKSNDKTILIKTCIWFI